jgi:hypothetical protein
MGENTRAIAQRALARRILTGGCVMPDNRMTIKVERETYKKLQLIKMGDEKLRNMTDVIEKLIADSEGVSHASKA